MLNGMVGDYLDRRGNALAIAMTMVEDGRPLPITTYGIAAAHPHATPKIAVLVHGWCCNESIWNFPEDRSTYGTKLHDDAGFTPIAVRFNSGLPLAQNGRELAQLLHAFATAYPVPPEEIVLLGHSMGGLVIRAACHVGVSEGHGWVRHVKRIFYLGTPHDGADLERVVHGATEALRAIPNPVTRLIGNVLNLRSRGVKDLRDGGPLVEGSNPDVSAAPLPWLPSAQHHRLVGTLHRNQRHPLSQALGDGLVRVPGATGSSGSPGGTLTVFPGVPHLSLAHDARVYAAIRDICMAPQVMAASG